MKHRCDLRFRSQRAFTHASLSHVSLCVRWAFLVLFCFAIFGCKHISRVNCAEITRDRLEQYVYENFSIEHNHMSFNFLLSRSLLYGELKFR